ncbi:DNA mismatch repair protein MutL [Ascobolus immersus RN42]|uniref:DNA mismatch repair protein MutL n=1 Tax=Ascobolus immersus RN42 TaxID=1160509 RepID=A0A3N4IBG1_ASCIM|nr:DNA mismatch repair protein MutL [Ascobolus immersus RN42]
MDSSTMSPPRTAGVKRKATEELAASAPRRIKPLDQSVVNKIAAGEIIVAPVNALKELIENSVDAGATTVDIVSKDGGLKLLQITDNGHGINKDDLPILCERFTTSKLKSFDDLSSIGTYGFRGEALASISHIAHLTVTTKTKDSDVAWRALFEDGKLVAPKPGQAAEPKPVAGRGGTQITVEDLFYNMPNRRKAFRSPSEEYQKILDIVGRYAVHCKGVGFSCKKHGDADMSLSVNATANTVDRIRNIHGSNLANELVEFKVADSHLGFTAHGLVSNANYSVKKTTLLLFINHRAVDCYPLKKGIEQSYATFLPKGGRPFVYISLEIEPHRVDVNIHPTKREVNFLHEDDIVDKICEAIRSKLAAVDTSRVFMTQTLLPGASSKEAPPLSTQKGVDSWKASQIGRATVSSSSSTRKVYENNLNRVDPTAQKITAMFHEQRSNMPGWTAIGSEGGVAQLQYEQRPDAKWKAFNYVTLRSLRGDVQNAMHNELYEMFKNHTFVGIVDERRRLAALQHGVKLYLVDYGAASFELFYQIGLADFGNFGRIEFDPPLSLAELLTAAVEAEKTHHSNDIESSDIDWEEAQSTVYSLIVSKRDILSHYFSLDITEDGMVTGMPLLLKGYMPNLGKLPAFLLRLGPNVEWDSELEFFKSFLEELAVFYVPESLPPAEGELKEEVMARKLELDQMIEAAIFPAFKRKLAPSSDLLRAISEIANLKGLYRIFERC